METILQLRIKFHLAYLLESSTASTHPRFKPIHKFLFQIFTLLLLLFGSVAMAETTIWNTSSSSEDLAIDSGRFIEKSETETQPLSGENNYKELTTINVGKSNSDGYKKPSGNWGNTLLFSTKNDAYFISTSTAKVTDEAQVPTQLSLTPSQGICFNTATANLTGTVSDATNTIYAPDGNFVVITINGVSQNAVITGGFGQFNINFPTSTLSAATYTITYAYAGDSNLQATTNTSRTLTVYAVSSAGTISANQTICAGNTASDISITGTVVGTVQWQSTDPSPISWTNIGSNSTTLTAAQIGTLPSSKLFRAIVTSGNCPAATSGTVTVTVNTAPTVGTVSANQSICSGSSPNNISVTSFFGVLQWQRADDTGFTTNLTNLGGSSNTLTGASIGALNATKYFRAVVTNGAICPAATSGTITVTVTPTILGNTSGSTISICENTSTILTGGALTGGTGTYAYLWESSTALAGTYTAATGTNNTANYTTAILTTASTNVYFRRTVTSGSCSSVATGFYVTVNSAATVGAVSADQVICAGSSPTSDITVANPIGTIQWQSADNTAFTSNLTNIGTGTATLTIASVGSLNATKYFRAKVTNGACASVYSATVTVTVNPAPAVGAVSGNQTICSGGSPTSNITIGSVTGTIQWQSADDTAFTIDTANIGTNSTTLTTSDIGILIANKYFRAQVTSGVCTSIYSAIVTVTVNPAAEANAGTDRVTCANGSIVLEGNIGGGAGTSTWSAPSGSFSNASSLTSNYTPSIASGTVVLTLTTNDPTGICPLATSTLNVTVNPSPVTAGPTICPGGSGSLTSSTVCASGSAVTSDYKDAGVGANNTGTGNTDWNNPGNIISNNNSYATVTLSNATNISRYLIGSNYSFNIPATATILGIQANVGRFSSLFFGYFDRIRDYDVQLVKAGTIVGTNKAKTGTNWTGSEVASSYGGTADLWGTTWTAADINNSNFGLAFSVQNNTIFGISYTASVDYMEISVTYSIPGGLNWYTVSSGGTLIGSGSPFNPVGVLNSGLPDTNTPGTTTFYGESPCSPGCRTATNFVINAKPSTSAITGPVAICANSAGNIYSVNNTVGSTYNWTVPTGATVTAGSGTNSITVTFGTASGNVAVTETNTATCPGTAVTKAVTINTLTPTLTSNDADNVFCSGTAVTFTATGGTNYNFRVAGLSVQNSTAATYITTALTNGQVVDVVVTNASSCTATSAGITNTVNALPIAGLTSNDADNTFCTGTSVIFTATGGTNYNFRVAGVSKQNSTTATYTTTALTNGQAVDVIVTNASGCVATSTGITNTVNASPTAGLTSSDGDNIFCLGTSVTFTATGGTNYNFRVAGVSKQNSTTATYATSAPPLTNGQVVDVIVTNASGCTATSTGITNTVNAPPTIGLTSNDADNKFCTGTSVTFTATGGTNYNFRIAGLSVQNSATATYTTATLTNGQVVNVTVTNAAGCTGTNAGITNTVSALPTAGLTSSDSDNTFCSGTSVTFTATGGTNYNFRVAGSSVQNSTTATYTTTSLTNSQVVDVIVTDASTGCTATSTGITNTITALPTVGLTSNDADNTFCSGTPITFTSTGGTNYNFRVAGSSVQNSTTATYTTATLTNGQVVDVIIANASGCMVTSAGITNIVNALPSTPTIGTITQPSCSVSTGSVILSGLPSGNWTINPGIVTGAGTSTTISGLTSGTINFTVTDATGCISLQSPVTISSGTSKRWLGTTSTDWFTDSNWFPAGVPDANTCVLVPNNVVTVYVSGTNKIAYASTLTVSNGGKLEVSSGNILVVTDFVNVDTGGTLVLQDSANLIQINNSNDSGIINSIRNTAPVVLNDYTYWSSPTSGSQTLHNFSPNSNPKFFLSYSNGWQYLDAGNTVFDKGIGYAIISPKGISTSSASSIKFQFDGTPNNGTITIPVTFDSSSTFSSKLIGNPYPSALDADKFIQANLQGTGTMNQTISGTLYFWAHNQPLSAGTYPQSDYATYNLTGGTVNGTGTGNTTQPTRWIASGQGFEVEAKVSGNVTFTNDMRTTASNYVNSNFYKNANITNTDTGLEKNRIWLNLTNGNSISSQTLIGYIETATNGYDPGFDGAYNSVGNTGFYSLIGNSNYTIQGRALPLTDADIVPLGYKTDIKGNLTISIDSMDGLFLGNQDIFIEDKLVNTIRSLKAGPYTFATQAGTFNNRFVLRYSETNALNDPNNINNNIMVSSKNQQIRIQSTLQNIEKVFIYDMLGRTIYKNSEIGEKETIISDCKTQQTLIIKIVLKNGQTMTKKLVNQ